MDMVNAIKRTLNTTTTENGAIAYSSTLNAVLDLFALGGAYRNRPEADVISLFAKAFEENEELAMKCLFWLRDARGGAGERRFFRICMRWLADNHYDAAYRNMSYISTYGRYDDLYTFVDTPMQEAAMSYLALTLKADNKLDYPTLAGKWAKSCNTSSAESRRLGEITRKYLLLSPRNYRKLLSKLRKRLNVLERLLSSKSFDEIDFGKIPSKAGLMYSHCFANREELKERYAEFLSSGKKVNASVLYPYECAKKAQEVARLPKTAAERIAVNTYWENLPDYIGEANASDFMCVCDTSASMTWSQRNNIYPIDIASSLAIYFAERAKGPFHNHYISFSSRPQLIEVNGTDFVDKVMRIKRADLCDNTNLAAVFELLLNIALSGGVAKEDFIKKLVIISDMEIDAATGIYRGVDNKEQFLVSTMEAIRKFWESKTDYPFPQLYYWNVNARNDRILSLGPDVSYVSGASPAILKQILSGKTNWELCLETITSDRYAPIH